MCPHCDSKALITSSNSLTATVKDLYCQCENTSACGARFVTTLAYKHTLNPPTSTTAEIAMSLINRLSKEEKAELQRDVAR
ncbi:MAG: cell division protein ZapA [Methyloprofundus sp.]|nr:MAG: cell division protein ZapA [Methyloprofundus sp.]